MVVASKTYLVCAITRCAAPWIPRVSVIADKGALYITDALICQYQGEQRSLLHYSVPLNQLWFSRDPVALDSLGVLELERQRDLAKIPQPKLNRELYANAELLELGVSNLKRIVTENAQ